MHHYLTRTSESLVLISRRGAHRILQVEIPRIALEHEFVMHCVLGVASLHLHHLAPDVPEYQSLTIAHRVNALSGLRMAISQLSKRKLSGSSDELTYALSLVFRSLPQRLAATFGSETGLVSERVCETCSGGIQNIFGADGARSDLYKGRKSPSYFRVSVTSIV